MTHGTEDLDEAFEGVVRDSTVEDYGELQDRFKLTLDNLAKQGVVKLCPDHQLGSSGLEVRVQLILEETGLSVGEGRPNLEDLVVEVPEFAKPSIPLVIEVKSGQKPSPKRSDLRQLDDWVFTLSGEAGLRQDAVQNQGRPRGGFLSEQNRPGRLIPNPTRECWCGTDPWGHPSIKDRNQL